MKPNIIKTEPTIEELYAKAERKINFALQGIFIERSQKLENYLFCCGLIKISEDKKSYQPANKLDKDDLKFIIKACNMIINSTDGKDFK